MPACGGHAVPAALGDDGQEAVKRENAAGGSFFRLFRRFSCNPAQSCYNECIMGKGLKFMRKFLSILMLVCLLCGLALPAGATGEETQLFAKFDESTTPQKELTIPKGLSRTITFFTTADGTDFTPISDGTFAKSGDAINLTESGGTYVVEGVALTEGTPVTISQNDSSLAPVNISVVDSHLELSIDNGVTWLSSLSNLSVGTSVSVRFRVGANGVFDDYTGDIAVDKPGLSVSGGKMTASKAGAYTLRVGDCTVTVSAVSNEITLADNDLSMLADQTKFDKFLSDNSYSGSGSLIIKLPAGNYGSVICDVTLPGGMGGLILQGATGTNMNSLIIEGINASVEGITFTGVPAITTNADCSVSRCTFSDDEPPPTVIIFMAFSPTTRIFFTPGATGRRLLSFLSSTMPSPPMRRAAA